MGTMTHQERRAYFPGTTAELSNGTPGARIPPTGTICGVRLRSIVMALMKSGDTVKAVV